LLGSISYFLLGLHDDIYKSSPILRLSIQFIIALSVSLMGINISEFSFHFPYFGSFDFKLPIFLTHFITCFWIVGVTNAINWLDGLDGLAGGYSLFVSLSLLSGALIFGNLQAVSIFSILTGSIIGFLVRNFKPAFYIMGDCGSYFLGFCLSTGSIFISSEGFENPVPFLYIVILFSLPIFDMLFVILDRFFKKQNPLKPNTNHIHHRMMQASIPYRSIISIIYSYSIFSVVLANSFL